MVFLNLICKANRLKKLKRQLIEEKQDAVKLSKKQATRRWRIRHMCLTFQIKLKKLALKACNRFVPKDSRIYKLCYNLRHDGSYENFVVKSVIGFLSGFLLTYVAFLFLVITLNFQLSTATLMCAILGSILTLGLAFSYTVRCIVLLTLPQLFSKKGRQLLLAYAFILAITGPAKNTLNNMAILSESLACGQEQLKSAVRQIIDVIKKPFVAIKEAIKKVVIAVKKIIKKIKEILLTIKRIIMSLIRVIKTAFQFLAKILNICNKELGTPFQRCSRVFDNAVTDCYAQLGPMFNWLCSITYLVKTICYIVKIFDLVCMIVDFISGSIIGVVIKKVKQFIRHIRTMFYVRIKFSHKFEFHSNSSKSLADVSRGIVGEIKDRSKTIVAIFDFMSSAATVFFIFIIFRVCYYRYKFLTSDRFDNKYITKDFIHIDLRRAKYGRETILPLNSKETNKYVNQKSKKLVKSERKELSKSIVSLGTATLKLSIHMIADYSLFWTLDIIRYYARFQSKVKAPNIPMVIVKGDGLLADLLKSVVQAFQPLGIELEIDTIPCLPDPIPPDFDRYIQIAFTLFLCWILTLLEPYGLRCRSIVMCYYYPTRGKQRAVWLYNHILRSRSSFLKFARRQLRRKVLGDKTVDKVTLLEFIRAKTNKWGVLQFCLGEDTSIKCLLCGKVFRENDEEKPIKCATPNCLGIYCEDCFKELQNLCTICLAPIEYGDLSDIDEEVDSSDEEQRKKKNIHTKLLKAKEDESHLAADSDYHSDDPLTDYSSDDDDDYDYQKEKKIPNIEQIEKERKMSIRSDKDVEHQKIPDYATMDSFHDVITATELLAGSALGDEIIVIYPPQTLQSSSTSSDVDFFPKLSYKRFKKLKLLTKPKCIKKSVTNSKSENKEKSPLLQCTIDRLDSGSESDDEMSLTDNNSRQKVNTDSSLSLFSPKPKSKLSKREKDSEDSLTVLYSSINNSPSQKGSDLSSEDNVVDLYPSLTTTPKSFKSESSIDSEIKIQFQNGNYQPSSSSHSETQQNVPTNVQTVDNISDTNKFENRQIAKYDDSVKFNVISETSSNIAVSTSAILSSSSSIHESKRHRKRICEDASTSIRSISFSSFDSEFIQRKERARVSKYYKTINALKFCKPCKGKIIKKNRSILQALGEFFGKLKRKRVSFPHKREIIELKPFDGNNSWRSSVGENTSPYLESSSDSLQTQETESSTTESLERIRGGAETLKINTDYLKTKEVLNIKTKSLMNENTGSKQLPRSIFDVPERDFPSQAENQRRPDIEVHFVKSNQDPISETTDETTATFSTNITENTCLNILGEPCGTLTAVETRETTEQIRWSTEDLPDDGKYRVFVNPKEYEKFDNSESVYVKPRNYQKVDNNQRVYVKVQDYQKVDDTKRAYIKPKDYNKVETREKHYEKPQHFQNVDNRERNVRSQNYENGDNRDRVYMKSQDYQPNYNRERVHINPQSYQEFDNDGKMYVKPQDYQQKSDRLRLLEEHRISQETKKPEYIAKSQEYKKREEYIYPEKGTTSRLIGTNTEPEDSRDRVIKSKKLQATQEQIDYFDKTFNCHKCPNHKGDKFIRNCSHRSANMSCCYCYPEHDFDRQRTCKYSTPNPPQPSCYCPDCGCCKCGRDQTEPAQNTSTTSRDTSTQTYMTENSIICNCKCSDCCSNRYNRPTERTYYEFDSSTSCISDPECSCYHEESIYNELPYQNNSDYMDLVEELENTLVTRNRNRVRKAMAEFECRSRFNRPLDKPIFDYDATSESEEPILQKITTLWTGKQTARRVNEIHPTELLATDRYWPQRDLDRRCRGNRIHWQLNPRTGEWYKIEPYSTRREIRTRTPSPPHRPPHPIHLDRGSPCNRSDCCRCKELHRHK